ncbi:hypothetical protein WJX73_008287 [Symbiochloris irregularis]|uniref:DNA-directed RNA polymerase subunit n=1 Tax=Symbiochloris irregularis TaxID=706552 RepID=A0AAW1NNR7_9CHLO
MLTFCPACGNLLMVEQAGGMRFHCQTCPYVYDIDRQMSKAMYMQQKEVDDVLGGADAWKNVQKTDVTCPKCSHPRAFFQEIQTRSADEPATLFFRCEGCAHQWKEG